MTATLNPLTQNAAALSGEQSDPLLFKRARTWLLVLALMLVSDGEGFFKEQVSPGLLLAKTHVIAPEGGGIYLLLTAATWTLCVALMARWFRPIVRLMLQQKAILAFPVLALLSALWSETPIGTFRKAILFFLAFAFGWFLAVAYKPTDQIRIFIVVGVIMALLSIPAAILVPSHGRDFQGQWKGVFSQKNELGWGMLFLFSGLPFRRIPTLRKLLAPALLAVLPLGLIAMSQSKEALVAVAVLLIARFAGPYIATRRREQLPFLLYATVFFIVSVALSYEFVFFLLGRDATLSGRTNEWSVLLWYAQKHFWLGYGYQAFWTTADSIQAVRSIKGLIHGADSTYVDTMLSLGVCGLALWVNLLFRSLRNVANVMRNPFLRLHDYWYSGLIVVIFLMNFVGSQSIGAGGFEPFVLALSYAQIDSVRSYANRASDS